MCHDNNRESLAMRCWFGENGRHEKNKWGDEAGQTEEGAEGTATEEAAERDS